jgi:hypothetical protein
VPGAPPALPDGLLLRSVYTTDEGEESGWRLWDDGRHEHLGGDGWEQDARLSPDQVAEVRAALDEADLAGMAGVHRDPETTRHIGVLWFQAASRDGPAAIALVGGASLPPLERLTGRLLAILSGGRLPY